MPASPACWEVSCCVKAPVLSKPPRLQTTAMDCFTGREGQPISWGTEKAQGDVELWDVYVCVTAAVWQYIYPGLDVCWGSYESPTLGYVSGAISSDTHMVCSIWHFIHSGAVSCSSASLHINITVKWLWWRCRFITARSIDITGKYMARFHWKDCLVVPHFKY